MMASKNPNRQLAAVIEEAGCTYEALAREVRTVAAEAGEPLHTSRSAIHSWVAGGTPAGKTAAYLAEALTRKAKRRVTTGEIGLGCGGTKEHLGPDPLATAADLGRYVILRRRNFLNSAFATAAASLPLAYDHDAVTTTLRAVRSVGRVGTEEIFTVRAVTETFRSADDKLGGGHGLSTVAVYLSDTVVPMLRAIFPSESVRRAAFGAAAELACLVGWKHHDLGREGAAQQFYLLGYQLACEADPHGHAAWMMRALTHQALDLRHMAHSVELAEASMARARGRVDRRTEALLLVTAARAYGANRMPEKASAALLSAEDAMGASADAVPSYAAASGPVASTVASHMGKTLTEMKDHRAAERHYRAALEGRTAQTYQRVRGLTMANLAKSVAAQRRHEEAVIWWNRSLDLMTGVDSVRSRKEVSRVRSAMVVYEKRGVPGAAELAQRAAELAFPSG
ncbi:tetratricopeptide repeat protein [Streptomyces sp. NBC_00690]|uniref:tetratricopeptide repeat protein n=1 Tax=Streptomyces sp. NBC_00690 TaxID=2975808 RepID=UPI002E27D3DF|nr:tetratricopeptide repeat protein [Streptomyces sp. NBC_00690]